MLHTTTAPRLAYDTTPGPGPRVLLVMGFGMRGHVWRPQIDGLGSTHRLAWYDHRALGESEGEAGDWTMGDLARDAVRVMDELGWPDAHVVGVSMGGMVAQELVLAEPERVRSLTLIATMAGGPVGWVPPLEGLGLFLRANLAQGEKRVQALERLLYTRPFLERFDRQGLEDRMLEMFGTPAPAATRRAQLRAVLRHHTLHRLPRVRTPTLIVQAVHDLLVRRSQTDRLYYLIPQAKLIRLDAGHGIIFERAAEVNEALRLHVAAVENGLPLARR